MIRRRRHHRTRTGHYCLLVNQSAAGYRSETLEELISAIRSAECQYTVIKPETPEQALSMARATLGLRGSRRSVPPAIARRGAVTSIIACGGDGTLNQAAQLAVEADLPVGILPMGRQNNIARSLLNEKKKPVEIIMSGDYRKVDMGQAGPYSFIGSLGIGFAPSLAGHLADRRPPRFGIGWSKLGGQAAAEVKPVRMTVKIDRFLFEASPLILNVNLLGFSCGLPLSPTSIADDGLAEVIFDQGEAMGEFSTFTRLISKRKYLYGQKIQLYRGRIIHLMPLKGRKLYIDGDLVEPVENELPIEIREKAVKVFC